MQVNVQYEDKYNLLPEDWVLSSKKTLRDRRIVAVVVSVPISL